MFSNVTYLNQCYFNCTLIFFKALCISNCYKITSVKLVRIVLDQKFLCDFRQIGTSAPSVVRYSSLKSQKVPFSGIKTLIALHHGGKIEFFWHFWGEQMALFNEKKYSKNVTNIHSNTIFSYIVLFFDLCIHHRCPCKFLKGMGLLCTLLLWA